jgi:hypothetical protein
MIFCSRWAQIRLLQQVEKGQRFFIQTLPHRPALFVYHLMKPTDYRGDVSLIPVLLEAFVNNVYCVVFFAARVDSFMLMQALTFLKTSPLLRRELRNLTEMQQIIAYNAPYLILKGN